MARRTLSEGEEMFEQLQHRYAGDLDAASIWELRAVMGKLHWNHRYRKVAEAAYWHKAWVRWHGGGGIEPAPYTVEEARA
jgi:hypothetical protein